VSVASGRNAAFDPGTRAILVELRDLRVEMRAEREVDRRRAEAAQRRSDERFERAMRESEERFQQSMREFREDSLRRDARMEKAFAGIQQAFKDVRSVGLSIVKTLNRHTRILERIDRKLGAPRHNGPRP